jgi:hypothetical protein
MNQSSAISRRIAGCLDAAARKDYEASLVHFFPALDKTAKRRRPKDGVGSRIRKFVADEEAIISAIATGNVFRNIYVDGISFPDAIYKFGRTAIAHEGELDRRLQITESNTLAIGTVWSLPASYIHAMCIAVMAAPENAQERLATDGKVTLFNQEWRLNQLWGAREQLRVAIANVFGRSDLFANETAA